MDAYADVVGAFPLDEVVVEEGDVTFDELYRRDFTPVAGLVYALSGSRQAAEELAQDAFLAAHRAWDRVGGYDDPGAWVRRVAVNRAVSAIRRRAAEARALVRLAGQRPLPDPLPDEAEAFWRAVRRLPARQAQTIALHYLEDRSVKDIATVLECAEPTVRVHLHRGRQALAVVLGEDAVTTALDRRAAAAAAAMRAAVANLEPAPGAAPPAGPRRWPALVAALVLLITAIAGAVLFRDNDGDTVVAGLDGALPKLVVEDLPGDLQPAGAADLPAEGSGGSTFRLYGRGDGNDPFRDGDLAVLVLRGVGGLTPQGQRVRVRGVDGALNEGGSLGRILGWEEPELGSVLLTSRSLPRAQLLPLAERLERRNDNLLLDAPPDGYQLVTDIRGLPGLALDITGTAERGSAARYQSQGADRFLAVTTIANRPGALDAVRWLGGPEARRTTVRGHDGWLVPPSTSDTLMPVTVLGWREGPGVLVTMTGTFLSDEELRTAAESLRPATDEEWRDLLASGEDTVESSENMPTLAASSPWRYSEDGDGGVCFEVTLPEGVASGACSGPDAVDDPRLYEGAETVEEGSWLHGRVSDEVAQVAVQPEGGPRQVVDTIPIEGGGRAWAALVPPGEAKVTIEALSADGTEVERTDVVPDSAWVGD